MIEAGSTASLWFLAFCWPVCFMVMWSDMAMMKIRNQAVVALFMIFVLVGPFVMPLEDYAWRYTHMLVVLFIGFLLNYVGLVGAGDAKFAAAAAPMVAAGDGMTLLILYAAVLLAAFVSHRSMRAFSPFRQAVPHWESWNRGDFPMGLALGCTLVAYLAFAGLYGA